MSQILNTSAVGLQALQKNIDTLANNIANVNTTGFKKDRVVFADALYQATQNPALNAEDSPVSLQLGYGTLARDVEMVPGDGPLQATGRSLDLALEGDGFFQVENEDGSRTFTRKGDFSSQLIDNRYYLVTSQGQFVLDQNGNRISATTDLEQASIDRTGQIMIGQASVGSVGRFSFTNPAELVGDSTLGYQATNASGSAKGSDAQLHQGSLEGSNVNLGEEMTRLMTSQRVYSLLSRAITTADQMRATENDIRR